MNNLILAVIKGPARECMGSLAAIAANGAGHLNGLTDWHSFLMQQAEAGPGAHLCHRSVPPHMQKRSTICVESA
jgi:hypothetical protein